MKSHILFLGVISLLGLSACETMKGSMRDMSAMGDNMTSTSVNQTVQPVNVETRADRGDMTPMPTPSAAYTPQRRDPMATGYGMNYQTSNTMGNEHVSVFNEAPMDMGYTRGVQQPYMMQPLPPMQPHPAMGHMPSYSGGVANFDPSVEIFSVDGSAPMMGNQNMNTEYYAGNHTHGNYMAGSNDQVYFNHGSSRLGNHDRQKLSQVAEQAKFAPVHHVTVAGHSSRPTQAGPHSVESHILNLKQSMDRSFAVSKELMKKGVPGEKIKTVSWGSAKATGVNTQDRRVDVIMGEQ